ncbi:MAG: hypothetical protein ACTS6H_02005 [Candidatus Hodgkinia cicadicola]
MAVAELKRKLIALNMLAEAVMSIGAPKALNHCWARTAGSRLISCIVT